MQTSFKKKAATDAAPEQGPVVNPSDNQVAVQSPRGAVSMQVSHQGLNDMSGEWLVKDRRTPRINIVQKSSGADLLKAFDLGDIVLGKNVKIADEENVAVVVAVHVHKDFQQVVPFGSGTGVVYPTEAAVFENGGTTDYSDEARNAKIYFGPRAHIQFAIKAPEEAEENELNYFPFTFEKDGSNWALGLITCASSSWTSLGKEIETLRQNNRVMLQGCVFGLLDLYSGFKKRAGQEWFVPYVKLTSQTEPELREFLLKLSGINAAAPATEQPSERA